MSILFFFTKALTYTHVYTAIQTVQKVKYYVNKMASAKINAYPQHSKFHPKAADTDKMVVPRSVSIFDTAVSEAKLVVALQS